MSSKIDYEEIAKLISFLEDKKLSHFELEVEGFRIKITRAVPSAPAIEAVPSPGPLTPPKPETPPRSHEVEPHVSGDNLHFITSPMVGTFYRTPDPNSPPFVDIGDEVKKNQTLCIIEAMKLMNEIESDVEGIVAEIFVENGKPVEYGQRLFAIQPVA
ncbi:MAG: acetyl-CoA carboxylase biotin carboxyl carrier protein [Clostridiales bacterium]|nr:acetyl-CoA carboxylase biotin carboxyl carrier protein [Clostridiales bacterium]